MGRGRLGGVNEDRHRPAVTRPAKSPRPLLPDIRKGQAIQAQDRANWEAWALVLAVATGRKPPPYQTNPLTGEKYQYAKYGSEIGVTNFGSGEEGDNPSIIVPDLGGGE